MAYHECDHQDESSPEPKTYQEISRFVKKSKCHKHVSDQDAGYLARIWKNAYLTSKIIKCLLALVVLNVTNIPSTSVGTRQTKRIGIFLNLTIQSPKCSRTADVIKV